MDNGKVKYRPEIDGLRALAVIAVIINHFDHQLLPSGYLGVDIFFVISGYVITASIASPVRSTLGDFLLNFYTRRIKRLAPALILFVLALSIATILLNPMPKGSLTTGVTALFGTSNLYLLWRSTDYFAASTTLNAFIHTWSLGVEEQFYVVYPFFVWFYISRSGDGSGVRALSRLILGLSVGSLIGFVVLYHVNQPAAYFLMPTRFWELGAGAMVYFLRDAALFNRPIERIPTGLVVAFILLLLFAPLSAAVPATIAVVALTAELIASLRAGTFAHAVFSRREFVYVGLISYSLYLWHWGVLWLSRWTIGIHGWTAPFQLALTFILAAASYRFVERPLRRANWSKWRPLSIGYGVSASMAAGGLIFVMGVPFGRDLYLGHLLNLPAPTNIEKTWWENRETGEYIEKCHVESTYRTEYIDECLAGKDDKRKHVYLIGDSHARNYLDALRGVFIGYEVRYLTMGYGCAFLPPEMATAFASVKCPEYVDASSRYLDEHVRIGDVVVIGQSLMGDNAERQSPAYFDFVKTFAKDIVGKGAAVVLLDGTVPPELPPEVCLDVPWHIVDFEGCTVTRAAVTDAYKEFDRLALDAAREIPNFYYAPLRTGLCRQDQCGQKTSTGTPIWHDRGHITKAASMALAPLLRVDLEKQGFSGQLAGLP